MNVKKTKKFKENRPENYYVHDSVAVTLGIGIGRAVSLGVGGSRVEVMGFMRTPRSRRQK